MLKTVMVLIVIGMITVSQSQEVPESSSDDLTVVQSILDQCGLNGVAIQEVTTVENSRVVSLDLTNKDVTKDGMIVIPSDIGKLTALRTLICSNNSITELPDEIGNLTELQSLNLQSNHLVSLNPAVGKCVNIVDLDLRHNQLESIPSEIGNLQKLTRLWLWGNKLTVLNEAIVGIKTLREIYLKDNRLTTLPRKITSLSLTYIDVIGNKICQPDPVINTWLEKWDKRYKEKQKCW